MASNSETTSEVTTSESVTTSEATMLAQSGRVVARRDFPQGTGPYAASRLARPSVVMASNSETTSDVTTSESVTTSEETTLAQPGPVFARRDFPQGTGRYAASRLERPAVIAAHRDFPQGTGRYAALEEFLQGTTPIDVAIRKLKKQVYNPPLRLRERKTKRIRACTSDINNNPATPPTAAAAEDGDEDYDHDDEDNQTCAICLDKFVPQEEVQVTPCGHIFHERCIITWLKKGGDCPLCRYAIFERKAKRE